MSATCRVIGDYHIIDPNNGFYEVWYVNPHDDREDDFVGNWESLHDAEWNALCMVQVDKILDAAGEVAQ